MNPMVSVIVPVYNAESTLEACVGSILAQTFQDMEVILVDDGSTDGSAALLAKLAEDDSRVKVVTKPNGGVSSARNAGLDVASGTWISFVDSDDTLPKDSIARLLGASFDDPDLWLSVGGFDVVRGGMVCAGSIAPACDKIYQASSLDTFFDENYKFDKCLLRAPWAKVFRNTGLRFNESISYGEDMLYVNAYLSAAPATARFKVVASPVYEYRATADGLAGDLSSDKHLEQLFRLIPAYSESIDKLLARFTSSKVLKTLYHNDLVGRLCCRVLTILATRKTAMLDEENIAKVYSYMAEDDRLGLFSLRAGQVPSILLQKIGSPALTKAFCRFTRILPIKPSRY